MIKDMKHFREKEIFGREVDLLARRRVERSRNYISWRAILEGVETYRNRDNAYLFDIFLNAKNIQDAIKRLSSEMRLIEISGMIFSRFIYAKT
jgi:hypothetical protein